MFTLSSVDSLNCRQGLWRSLDDFSRTSTPRRTMDFTDHMIPEEPSYDFMDGFPGPCRSPPKMNRVNNRRQYDDPYRSDGNLAFYRAIDGSPTEDDVVSSNRFDYESEALLRRRLVAPDDGVQDNNLINSQLQELQSSALSESAASLRNGRAGNRSAGGTTGADVGSFSTWRLVTFWTLAFMMLVLGVVIIVAVVRVPGLISSNGAARGGQLPDLQEEVEPEQCE